MKFHQITNKKELRIILKRLLLNLNDYMTYEINLTNTKNRIPIDEGIIIYDKINDVYFSNSNFNLNNRETKELKKHMYDMDKDNTIIWSWIDRLDNKHHLYIYKLDVESIIS